MMGFKVRPFWRFSAETPAQSSSTLNYIIRQPIERRRMKWNAHRRPPSSCQSCRRLLPPVGTCRSIRKPFLDCGWIRNGVEKVKRESTEWRHHSRKLLFIHKIKIDHEIGGYRHASYHPTDRWLKGWLGPHVAYHHWWPVKWQFLYLIVFSPLGRPLVLFCISHWRMVPGHVSRAAAACTPESIKVCSVIFVPWSRVQYLLEWLCPLTPHLIPHRILKFILCGCLLKMNERKSTTGQ
jgi:hypothetical protein